MLFFAVELFCRRFCPDLLLGSISVRIYPLPCVQIPVQAQGIDSSGGDSPFWWRDFGADEISLEA